MALKGGVLDTSEKIRYRKEFGGKYETFVYLTIFKCLSLLPPGDIPRGSDNVGSI